MQSGDTIYIALGVVLWFVSLQASQFFHRRLSPQRPGFLKAGFLIFAGCFFAVLLLQLGWAAWLGAEEASDQPMNDRLLRMALVQGVVYLATILWLGFARGRQGLREMGWSLPRGWTLLGFSVTAYISFYPIYVLACVINSKFMGYEPQELVKEFMEKPELLKATPMFLCATLFVPVLEEILFRGFLYSGLREYLPHIPAIIISAVFFALMHELQAAIPVFALGLILGYLRERTGSLIPAIVVHVLHNSLMLILLPFL